MTEVTVPSLLRQIDELLASGRITDEEAVAHLVEAYRAVHAAMEDLTPPPKRAPRRRDDGEVEDEPDEPRRRPRRMQVLQPANFGDGVQVNWSGNTPRYELRDTILLGGYRSCLKGLMGTGHLTELYLDNVELRPAEPNGPPDWDGRGTYWAARMYGIKGGMIRNVRVADFFGAGAREKSNEGHGFYLTLSMGDGDMLIYDGCRFENMGGHGIYHTSANQKGREGNASPATGGEVQIINTTVVRDTDQSAARGAYAITLTDAVAAHTIRDCHVSQAITNGYAKYGKLDKSSRALLLAQGQMGALEVHDSRFSAESPSDRSAQVMVEGPPLALFVRTHFDCDVVSVNDPWGDSEGTLKTERLVVKDCTGRAKLFWNGQLVGRFDELDRVEKNL
jgi:hypothetical protein